MFHIKNKGDYLCEVKTGSFVSIELTHDLEDIENTNCCDDCKKNYLYHHSDI